MSQVTIVTMATTGRREAGPEQPADADADAGERRA